MPSRHNNSAQRGGLPCPCIVGGHVALPGDLLRSMLPMHQAAEKVGGSHFGERSPSEDRVPQPCTVVTTTAAAAGGAEGGETYVAASQQLKLLRHVARRRAPAAAASGCAGAWVSCAAVSLCLCLLLWLLIIITRWLAGCAGICTLVLLLGGVLQLLVTGFMLVV